MFTWMYEISARFLSLFRIFRHSIKQWMKPEHIASGFVADLPRSRTDLILENALLRQQLIILRRQIKRPQLNNRDRLLLILLARLTRSWKQTLLIVQPDTLLRWHREMFRLLWSLTSRTLNRQPRLSHETIQLVQQMARDNRLWGAERIRGELLKLGIHLTQRSILIYMLQVRKPHPSSQH